MNLNKYIKTILSKTLSNSVEKKLYVIYFNLRLKYVQFNQKKALRHIRKKEKIKVAFFLIHDAVWKYEGIYKLLENNKRFELVIVICPDVIYGEDYMQKEMEHSYNDYKNKGYNVISTLNKETGKWLNIKKEINPDIIFFVNPHQLTKKEYYITNYLDTLTCYAPYNFGHNHLYQKMYNQLFHNVLWLLFAETQTHKDFSIKYALNKGTNVVVTGFPGTDIFLDKQYIPKNYWKQANKTTKRIIWAPHHSIESDTSYLSFSTFLLYANAMIKIAGEYKGKIQIAFKPHPLLRPKLYQHPDWGVEKTDTYFTTWNTIENGQLEDGRYEDLFITSDAMIHDSGSFLIEYLYTGKPVLHINRDDSIRERLNSFGVEAFNQHYHAKNEQDIRKFIEDLLANRDEKKSERENFLHSKLLPPNNKSASENIYDEITKRVL